jgi:hypothetical protein
MRSLPSAGVELFLFQLSFCFRRTFCDILLTFAIPIILDLLCSLRPEDYDYLPTYD